MLWIDQGGNRRSQAFLARTFSIKTRENYFIRKEEQKERNGGPVETDAARPDSGTRLLSGSDPR
jgi:hypothetical protein